jgi:hypothetical protein
MNTGHQDGKTEPASQAMVWDFGLGKGSLDFSQRKRMNGSASNLTSDALLPKLLAGELRVARLQN